MIKIPKIQWVIAALLCLATMINYADRLTLSMVSVDIRSEFGLSEQDYSYILTLFLLAYAVMYAVSGYIVDRLGTRRGFAVFIFGWSLAQLLHAFAFGKWSLAGCRFLLGLCEPANWPAAAKAVSEWYPASQRALIVGIFNAGSSLGSAIAPPMVAYIAVSYGWRAAFIFTGGMGLVWMVLWLIIYEPPARNRWLRPQDAPQLEELAPAAPKARPDWRKVIATRECYTLIIARFFTDPVIYFIIFWLPEYLRKERAFNLADVGKYAWVPFVVGGVGYTLGGWLSGHLMERGWTLPRSRKIIMGIGAACLPVSIFAPLVPNAALAIAATSFATFGHGFWVANLQTLPTDLFVGSEVGTAMGFSGMGGAVGGMIANLGTGYIVAHYSYAPVFLMAGLMHPLSAFLVYWLLPDRYFRIRVHSR
jgi:MFS transporter, ACS family, hexuronate transporter